MKRFIISFFLCTLISFSFMGIECNTDGQPTFFPGEKSGGIMGLWKSAEGISSGSESFYCQDCSWNTVAYTKSYQYVNFSSDNIARSYHEYSAISNPNPSQCTTYPEFTGVYYCDSINPGTEGLEQPSDMTYSINGNMITLDDGNMTIDMPFSIVGDTLYLGPDPPITFTRASIDEVSSAQKFCMELPKDSMECIAK
ncbi:hypothetical protein ACFL20_08815 [Spirochaetota bacterium]